MKKRTEIYRPLSRAPKFHLERNRIWVADDHLLLVTDRFMREIYARIYWTDIQAILLYSLQRPRGVMLALEVLCLLAVAGWAFVSPVWGAVLSALFLAIYACWRFTRPNWACQISTRLSTLRLPLQPSRASSRRTVDQIALAARSAQGADIEDPATTHPFIGDRNAFERKRPRLLLHAVTFTLGLFTPLHTVLLVIYYFPLIALYFFQRQLEFPFSVRAAAVMSQILAGLQLAWWLPALWHPVTTTIYPSLLRTHWAGGLRILFSLAGIAAIYHHSLENARERQKSSTILGLS